MKKLLLFTMAIMPAISYAQTDYTDSVSDVNSAFAWTIILIAILSIAILLGVIYWGVKLAMKKTNKILEAMAIKMDIPIGAFNDEKEIHNYILKNCKALKFNGILENSNPDYVALKNKLRGWNL